MHRSMHQIACLTGKSDKKHKHKVGQKVNDDFVALGCVNDEYYWKI